MSVAEPQAPVAEVADLSPTLRVRTRVLPGERIVFTSPHLTEGEVVEVNVHLPADANGDKPFAKKRGQDAKGIRDPVALMAWLESLPSRRTPEEWEEFEREFREGRGR